MLLLTTNTTNRDKKGNGRYTTLKKRKRTKEAGNPNDFTYLSNTDLTMQFNKSRDPIYFAFEFLQKRSIPQLMGDFVKDSFYEITNFVSKVVPKEIKYRL